MGSAGMECVTSDVWIWGSEKANDDTNVYVGDSAWCRRELF